MPANVIVWDIETVPDLKGFAAANGTSFAATALMNNGGTCERHGSDHRDRETITVLPTCVIFALDCAWDCARQALECSQLVDDGRADDYCDFKVLGLRCRLLGQLLVSDASGRMVPANAEIVLECELMATEGWVHDEAPFGEVTGMYGGGLKHNVRAVVKAITHRKNGIFQYATIGYHLQE